MARQISAKKPNDFKKTMANLFVYLKRHRFIIFIAAILVALGAIINLYGTYMIKPIVNTYIANGDYEGLVNEVVRLAIIYFIGVISVLLSSQMMIRVSQVIIGEIRHDLFKKMQSLPLSYFDTTKHGDIMSNYTNDMDTLSECLNNSFSMIIKTCVEMVGTICLLLYLNPLLSLIVFFFYIIMYLYIQYSSKHSKHYYHSQQTNIGKMNGFIKERISGQKVIKVFNHEKENIDDFDKINIDLRNSSTNALKYSLSQVPSVVSISYINYALVAVIGGLMVINNLSDVGSLAAYLIFVRQSSLPINQFTGQSNFILAALSGAERIFDTMSEPSEVDEGRITSEYKDGNLVWKDGSREVNLSGDIAFNNVSFSYKENEPVLKDLSLYADKGQKIAFVGATGAGKTTITNLLNRFYDVNNGTITFDGIDIRDIKKKDLRKNIGIVLQDTHLFSGTIKDNIRYGNIKTSDEEVIAAAKIANADSFIRKLPNGYDTYITSDGANLSQGQRQLLAIARAATSKCPVLILDEATSSIDTRTEKLIEKALDSLMENKTVFIIAHRLSTVRNADAIMVLDHGKIIERGSHEELLKRKGMYYELYMGMFELE